MCGIRGLAVTTSLLFATSCGDSASPTRDAGGGPGSGGLGDANGATGGAVNRGGAGGSAGGGGLGAGTAGTSLIDDGGAGVSADGGSAGTAHGGKGGGNSGAGAGAGGKGSDEAGAGGDDGSGLAGSGAGGVLTSVVWEPRCADSTCLASAPVPRQGATAAFDPIRHEVLMYGGETFGNSVLAETWGWDGTAWTERCPASTCESPLGSRYGSAVVFDPEREGLVLRLRVPPSRWRTTKRAT